MKQEGVGSTSLTAVDEGEVTATAATPGPLSSTPDESEAVDSTTPDESEAVDSGAVAAALSWIVAALGLFIAV